MSDRDTTTRFRGAILTLTLLLALSLVAEALAPMFASAAPKAEQAASIARVEPQRHKNDKKDRSKRRGVNAQIIGGTVVPQGSFSFMAAVIEDEFFTCGGTLIDPSFVLTAAHCVTDEIGNPIPAEDFEVAAGKLDLSALTEANFREVETIAVHPDWDPELFENDVAILGLDEAFPASIAQPIPFVRLNQTALDKPGREAVVAGWGLTSVEPPAASDQLREATLELISGSTCSALFLEFEPSTMLCATAPGRDTCFGDSGGPLTVKGQVGTKKKKRKKGKHGKRKKKRVPIFGDVQTGIVSFGSEECDTAGAYTRISAPGINDFIVETVSS